MIYCINALRGTIPSSFPDIREYNKYYEDKEESEIFNMLLHDFWKCIGSQLSEKTLRAKRLQTTSWMLIMSFSSLLLAAILLFHSYFFVPKEVIA